MGRTGRGARATHPTSSFQRARPRDLLCARLYRSGSKTLGTSDCSTRCGSDASVRGSTGDEDSPDLTTTPHTCSCVTAMVSAALKYLVAESTMRPNSAGTAPGWSGHGAPTSSRGCAISPSRQTRATNSAHQETTRDGSSSLPTYRRRRFQHGHELQTGHMHRVAWRLHGAVAASASGACRSLGNSKFSNAGSAEGTHVVASHVCGSQRVDDLPWQVFGVTQRAGKGVRSRFWHFETQDAKEGVHQYGVDAHG